MTRNIKQKFFSSSSPEVICDYMTKSELMEQWLMKKDFQPIVRLEFSFKTNTIPNLSFSLKKLCYSCKSSRGNIKLSLSQLVSGSPLKKGGTELFLQHIGFLKRIYRICSKSYTKSINRYMPYQMEQSLPVFSG